MRSENANAALAALVIVIVFGLGAYFLPTMMLAVGEVSTIAAGVLAVAFVAAFFLLFWLRGRSRRSNDSG